MVLPAATAHSRPDEYLEPDNVTPTVARWFTRATIRLAIIKPSRSKAFAAAAEAEAGGAEDRVATEEAAELFASVSASMSASAPPTVVAAASTPSQPAACSLEQERLLLGVLVAKHVWGDPTFATAAAAEYAAIVVAAKAGVGGGPQCLNDKASPTTTPLLQTPTDTGDCQNGVGQRVYEDGSIYSGAWKAGKQHGNGKMCYSGGKKRGNVYEGGWVDGMPHGTCLSRCASLAWYVVLDAAQSNPTPPT